MNIKELVFDVEVTKTYQITVSTEQGFDMPKTPKALVEMVNVINDSPYGYLDMANQEAIDTVIEVTHYEIKEA
jgi:hypothetical protein